MSRRSPTVPDADARLIEEAEALRQEVAANSAVMVALKNELSAQRIENTIRVEGYKAQSNRHRRIRATFGAGAIFSVVAAYDSHVTTCSPGARTNRGVDVLLANPKASPEEAMRLFNDAYNTGPIWCDVQMPFHSHAGDHWPTHGNLVSFGILLSLLAVLIGSHAIMNRRDFRKVGKAAAAEAEVASRIHNIGKRT